MLFRSHNEPGPNPAQFGSAAADAIPGGKLIEYPHVGHFGPFQDPETIAADVLGAIDAAL